MDNNNHLYAVAQVASENEMSKYQLRPYFPLETAKSPIF
jgi:hypothetical protein